MTFLKRHKNDVLLILAVLILAGGVWLWTYLTRSPGAMAVVTVNGEELMRLPLDEDSTTLIGEGEHTNLLVIRDGTVSVTQASCPDHVCIRRGEVAYNGETIVCLPNKLVVSIEGGAEGDVDVVAGGQG